MATTITLPNYPSNAKLSFPKHVKSRAVALQGCFRKNVHGFGQKPCLIHVAQASFVNNYRWMAWSIRSSTDSSGFDPSSTNGGSTRLIRTIQAIQSKLGVRIRELRKNLPMKLLFFLGGFYCATAFSTVIGQTGDWDILSAALAVVVVEGIGALMYRGSLPVVNKIRSLITMFNYWKAGLSLGLFLDSFKYEMDNITGLSDLFNFEIDYVLPIFL